MTYSHLLLIYNWLYLCSLTSLEDLSLSLDKLEAGMQQFIHGSPLTNVLCWPFVFSHLKLLAAPRASPETAAKAGHEQAANESDAVIELTQQWIQGIVEKATLIICTLHQA